MILGNYGMQHGWQPEAFTDWFHRSFVDGYDWVMVPNVVGMSQHADGGVLATKPYAAGGNYINKMTDYCGDCRFDPKVRVGPDACPFTAGYWRFLHRHRERFAANPRMSRRFAASTGSPISTHSSPPTPTTRRACHIRPVAQMFCSSYPFC